MEVTSGKVTEKESLSQHGQMWNGCHMYRETNRFTSWTGWQQIINIQYMKNMIGRVLSNFKELTAGRAWTTRPVYSPRHTVKGTVCVSCCPNISILDINMQLSVFWHCTHAMNLTAVLVSQLTGLTSHTHAHRKAHYVELKEKNVLFSKTLRS